MKFFNRQETFLDVLVKNFAENIGLGIAGNLATDALKNLFSGSLAK
jgi:hypothetical protein